MSTAFNIAMSGAQQVPSVVSTASGLGTAIYDSVAHTLEYTIVVTGLDFGAFTGGSPQTPGTADDVLDTHFHAGARGANGGVVFAWASQDADDLTITLQPGGSWLIHGMWELTDPGSSLASFEAALGSTAVGADMALYANLHTTAFGGGELRGQLVGMSTDLADIVNGTSANDVLYGLDGADTLTGGLGADTLTGGLGDDVFQYGASLEVAFGELIDGGGGTDRIAIVGAAAAHDFTSATGISSIEELVFAPTSGFQSQLSFRSSDLGAGLAANLAVTGSSLSEVITIGAAAPGAAVDLSGWTFTTWNSGVAIDYVILNGDTGDEMLVGTSQKDTISGLGGADTLSGNGGDDFLVGGAGADVLVGGAGADVMAGGAESDNYYVDDAGDTVIENPGEGTVDTVFFTDVAGVLSAEVEYGFSLGTAASLTGNSADNVLIGGYATVAQTLTGNDGNDFLSGTAVADTLDGGNGVDTLLGRGGGDQLSGGAGSDNYYVELLADVVTELAGPGAGINDIVYTNVNATLAANVEVMFTYGAATSVDGNSQDNAMLAVYSTHAMRLDSYEGNDILYGSSFSDGLFAGADDDIMFGSAGGPDGASDFMFGGDGNDQYFVQEASDQVDEDPGQGTDTVYAALNYTLGADLETLFIYGAATTGTGNGADNALIGSYINTGVALNALAGNDTVIGGGGADTLTGGLDNDMLTGAAGADDFIFNAGDGLDTILDFNQGEADQVHISTVMAADFTDLINNHSSVVGGHVTLSFVGGQTITLMGIANPGSLAAGDFVFF